MTTENLWLTYSEELLRYFNAKLNDAQAAEDLRQEVFLKAHKHLDRLKDDDKAGHWLRVIARNALADHWKGQQREDSISDLALHASQDERFNRLASECVTNMVHSLPEDYAMPLKMSDLDGMKQQEVAQKLGLGLSATKSRIQRGRVMLKENIASCCGVVVNERNEIIDSDCHEEECG